MCEPFFDEFFKGWWLWCLTKLLFPLIIFSFAQLEFTFVTVSLQHDEDEEEVDDAFDSTNCIALLFLVALSWFEFIPDAEEEIADNTVVVVIEEGCCWCTKIFWDDEDETNWLSIVVEAPPPVGL